MSSDNPICADPQCGHPMDPCHGDRAIAPCVFDTKNGSFTVAIRCKCKGFRLTTSIENRTSVEAVPDPSGTRS